MLRVPANTLHPATSSVVCYASAPSQVQSAHDGDITAQKCIYSTRACITAAAQPLSNRRRKAATTARPTGKSSGEPRNGRYQSSSLAGGGPHGDTIICARVKGGYMREVIGHGEMFQMVQHLVKVKYFERCFAQVKCIANLKYPSKRKKLQNGAAAYH